jgi:hypothetical protein
LCVEEALETPDALKLAALHAHQLELRKKLDEGEIFLSVNYYCTTSVAHP